MDLRAISPALAGRLGADATAGLVDLIDTVEGHCVDIVMERSVERFERRLSEDVSTLRVEMARLGADLRQEITTVRSDLRQEMATLGSDLRGEMATLGSRNRDHAPEDRKILTRTTRSRPAALVLPSRVGTEQPGVL